MLKGIDPLIGPELLYTLAGMGHGDQLAIVDRNFPAMSTNPRVHRLDGVDVASAMQAVLSLVPLDSFVPSPIECMEIIGRPGVINDVQEEVLLIASTSFGREIEMARLERSQFYARTSEASAVLVTGEGRPFGCFIITKGVLPDFLP